MACGKLGGKKGEALRVGRKGWREGGKEGGALDDTDINKETNMQVLWVSPVCSGLVAVCSTSPSFLPAARPPPPAHHSVLFQCLTFHFAGLYCFPHPPLPPNNLLPWQANFPFFSISSHLFSVARTFLSTNSSFPSLVIHHSWTCVLHPLMIGLGWDSTVSLLHYFLSSHFDAQSSTQSDTTRRPYSTCGSLEKISGRKLHRTLSPVTVKYCDSFTYDLEWEGRQGMSFSWPTSTGNGTWISALCYST